MALKEQPAINLCCQNNIQCRKLESSAGLSTLDPATFWDSGTFSPGCLPYLKLSGAVSGYLDCPLPVFELALALSDGF